MVDGRQFDLPETFDSDRPAGARRAIGLEDLGPDGPFAATAVRASSCRVQPRRDPSYTPQVKKHMPVSTPPLRQHMRPVQQLIPFPHAWLVAAQLPPPCPPLPPCPPAPD
jgi:hypothetical protein